MDWLAANMCVKCKKNKLHVLRGLLDVHHCIVLQVSTHDQSYPADNSEDRTRSERLYIGIEFNGSFRSFEHRQHLDNHRLPFA